MKLLKTVAVQKKGSPVEGWPRLYSSNKRKEKWGTLRFTPLFTSLLYIYDSLSWSILHFLIRSGSVHATYGRSRTHEPLHLDPRNQNENPEPPNNKLDNLDLTLNSKSQSGCGSHLHCWLRCYNKLSPVRRQKHLESHNNQGRIAFIVRAP